MKKSFFTIGFLAVCILIAANSYAADEYNLSYNFKKGDVFKHTFPVDIAMTLNIEGQNMDMPVNLETAIAIRVVSTDNKVYTLDFCYTRFKTVTNIGALQINIDTDNPDEGGHFAQAAQMLKSIINIPFKIKIDKLGNIIAISGMDKLQKALADMAAKSDDPTIRQITESTFKQYLSEASCKDMLGQSLTIYPEKPLKIGDSWNSVNTRMASDAEIKINMKHTLKEVKDNIAVIEAEGEIQYEGTTAESIPYSMKGDIAGTTQVNLETGMALSGESSMNCEMLLNVQSREIQMKILVNSTLKCE